MRTPFLLRWVAVMAGAYRLFDVLVVRAATFRTVVHWYCSDIETILSERALRNACLYSHYY